MRLSNNTLSHAKSMVQQFSYPREKLSVGIIHLGIGAFHRAHQAVYIDDYINKTNDLSWGIIGASLRSAAVSQQMNPQNGLYSVMEKNNMQQQLRIVGCIQQVIVAPELPLQLIQVLTDADVKIVSLTITEKGYYHDPASGQLQLNHPDIQHDLIEPDNPITAIGYLVTALKIRYEHGIKPFTVLSCDNLPNNGHIVKHAVITFAEQFNSKFAEWIEQKVAFPCTMVDRIVPATSAEDRHAITEQMSLTDEAAVVAEPFKQWIIEDHFAAGRPAWENVGVTMVDNVQPFEEMKLRLLNGCHSTMAYLGYLAGYQSMAEVMQQADFARLIRQLMDNEITPTLQVPQEIDLAAYKQALLQRFSNTALQHKTRQVAMDGSQKIPQRLLNTIRYQLQHNGSIDLLSLAIAGWIRYCTGVDEAGNKIEISDPLADQFLQITQQANGNIEKLVDGFLSLREVFGDDLAEQQLFRKLLITHLQSLYKNGSLVTVKNILV